MADFDQAVSGALGLMGEVTEIRVSADNPAGVLTMSGSVATLVGASGQTFGGSLGLSGELSTDVLDRGCFPTTFDCVGSIDSTADCVGVCDDNVVPEPPGECPEPEPCPDCPDCPDCPECPECPECPPCPDICPPLCPATVDSDNVILAGAVAGDVVPPAFVVTFDTSDAVTNAWKSQTDYGGVFLWQFHEAGDFGAGFGPTPTALNGTGHLRGTYTASFQPTGKSTIVYRRFGGYVAGQSVGLSWVYYHQDVFGNFTKGLLSQTVVANGSGEVVAGFQWTENFTGLLLYEAYWIEDLLIQNPEVPVCP